MVLGIFLYMHKLSWWLRYISTLREIDVRKKCVLVQIKVSAGSLATISVTGKHAYVVEIWYIL